MADGMHVDPRAIAAVGNRLGSTGDALRRAIDDAATARFGPDSVAPELRDHGIAYAAGIGELRAVIEAMTGSVAHLVGRLDAATATLSTTDADAGARIRAAGEST